MCLEYLLIYLNTIFSFAERFSVAVVCEIKAKFHGTRVTRAIAELGQLFKKDRRLIESEKRFR